MAELQKVQEQEYRKRRMSGGRTAVECGGGAGGAWCAAPKTQGRWGSRGVTAQALSAAASGGRGREANDEEDLETGELKYLIRSSGGSFVALGSL